MVDHRMTFTKLAPVLNVSDLAAERRFYESLGLTVTYEGPEYPDFIAFGAGEGAGEGDGAGTVDFGIQQADGPNDPASVLTWQIGIADVDAAIAVCESRGIAYALDVQRPAEDWTYRRLLLTSPSGFRVALEGPTESAEPAAG